jgi:hypothetical protein
MAERDPLHADPPAGPDAHHGDPDADIAVGPVAKVMVAIAVIGLVAAALVWPLVHGFLGANLRRQPETRIDLSRPGGPLLQAAPELDLQSFRAGENVALGSYGWVDEGAGVARIPVARAAELVLEQGLELRSGPPAAPGAPAPSAAEEPR